MLKANGLYGFVQNNNFKSAMLLLGYMGVAHIVAFALFLGYAVTSVVGTNEMRMQWAVGHLTSWWPLVALCAAAWSWSAYRHYEQTIRDLTGSTPLSRAQDPDLYNLVENIAIEMGLPVPRIEIVNSQSLNAYASGLSPRSSVLGLTSGLLKSLSRNELEAVIAHEMTHIRLLDVRLLTLATIFTAQAMAVASFIFKPVLTKGYGRFFLICVSPFFPYQLGLVLLTAVLTGGLSALFLRFAISRTREFVADAGACEITKNPQALIAALSKISGREMIANADLMVQSMMIAAPASRIFQTHPSTEQRIAAIEFYAANALTAGSSARFAEPAGACRPPLRAQSESAMTMESFSQLVFPGWVIQSKVLLPVYLIVFVSFVATNKAFWENVPYMFEVPPQHSSSASHQPPQVSSGLTPTLAPISNVPPSASWGDGSKANPAASKDAGTDVSEIGSIVSQLPIGMFIGQIAVFYLIFKLIRRVFNGTKRAVKAGANFASSSGRDDGARKRPRPEAAVAVAATRQHPTSAVRTSFGKRI
jgi:heat shock protein HtpX